MGADSNPLSGGTIWVTSSYYLTAMGCGPVTGLISAGSMIGNRDPTTGDSDHDWA